jgi:hypothetical protein
VGIVGKDNDRDLLLRTGLRVHRRSFDSPPKRLYCPWAFLPWSRRPSYRSTKGVIAGPKATPTDRRSLAPAPSIRRAPHPATNKWEKARRPARSGLARSAVSVAE